MNYIVHVIDNASQYKKGDNFEIVQSINEKNEPCEVLLSESFYRMDAQDPQSAVASVVNTIRVKTAAGEKISIAQSFLETSKALSSSDFDQTMPDRLLSDLTVKREINPYSVYITASCHIEKDEVIELHRVEFYVVEEQKIMEII